MGNNLALNKPAYASSFVSPFTAQKAVDGKIAPIQRWICAVMPGWLKVDLGSIYWIERWVVKHMGSVGWPAPDYNMKNYKLQGSLDNANWFDMDTVTNNSAGATDRTFPLIQARFIRVYMSIGLNTNQGLASITELEIYGTQSLLSELLVRAGRVTVAINPPFNPTTFDYYASVANSVSSVTVTPTAPNSSANIKVNGQTVISGQASSSINLNVGQNTITVIVSSANDANREYTIGISRTN